MARLTDTNMTPAERAAFGRLQHALGFSPKVLFGRDKGNDFFFHRLVEAGTPLVYALAVAGNGQKAKKGVREFRLLVAPVKVAVAKNGTRHAAKPQARRRHHIRDRAAWKAHIREAVKRSWAKRKAAAAAAKTP